MDDQILIEKYLHGDLSEEAKSLLAKRIETDSDFAERLQIESVFYANRNLNLKTKLRKITAAGNITSIQQSAISWKRIVSIAATVTLLVSALWIYQSRNNTTTYSHLIENYITEKPDAPITTMGALSESNIWLNAIQAYQVNNYQKAYNLINSITNPTAEQQFYSAITLMRIQPPQTQNALNILQEIIDKPTALFKDQAMWYAALCYIDLKQLEQSNILLTEIVRTQSWRHDDAQLILNTMPSE